MDKPVEMLRTLDSTQVKGLIELVKEMRDEYNRKLSLVADIHDVYRLQGKIQALDRLIGLREEVLHFQKHARTK